MGLLGSNDKPIAEVSVIPGVLNPLLAAASGVNVQLVATLDPLGKLAHITGFIITGGGATASSMIEVTITGLAAVPRYKIAVPAGADQQVILRVAFDTPIPANAVGAGIVVTVPAFGAGSLGQAVVVTGYAR